MSLLLIMVKFMLIIQLFLNILKLFHDYLLINGTYLTHLIVHKDSLMKFYTLLFHKYFLLIASWDQMFINI